MALPRYKPSEVRLNTGAGIGQRAVAQTYQTLSQKMNEWSDYTFKQGAEIRQREGKEDAIMDVAKTGTYRDVGTFSVYDKAYKDAAHTSYAVGTEHDIKNFSSFAETSINNNPDIHDKPDAFLKSWEKYTATTIAAAPDEYAKAITSKALDSYGTNKYNTMYKAHEKKVYDNNKKTFEDGISLAEENYFDAISSGNDDEKLRNLNTLISLNLSGEKNQFTNASAVDLRMEKFYNKVYAEENIKSFNESKDKTSFIKNFRKTSTLTDTLTQATINRMHSNLKSQVEDNKIQNDLEDAEDIVYKETAKRDILKKFVANTLTKGQLESAVANGIITTSTYDDLTQRMNTVGISKSDDKTYNYYLKNMDTTTLDAIYADENLSRADKDKLIARYEKLESKEEDEADWEASRDGKQAILEIKTKFQVLDNMIMRKVDFKNENIRDYSVLRSMLYDEVNSFAPEERTRESLKSSRRLIKEYTDGEIVGTKPYNTRKDTEATAKAEKEKEAAASKEAEEIKGQNVWQKLMGF